MAVYNICSSRVKGLLGHETHRIQVIPSYSLPLPGHKDKLLQRIFIILYETEQFVET